jgi:COP9 signalosome complex subunit 4
MESKLAQFSALSQKDKGPAFISLLPEIIARPNQSTVATDLRILVNTVVNQDNVGLVVGRQVLSELVKILGEGAIKDVELRKRVVEDTLATVQPRIVSYEEQASLQVSSTDSMIEGCLQVNSLRFQLADLLEQEEEWSDAARVLMGISLDSGQR